ncbi:hypothetical protein BDZ94DRAFT_1309217 [Collybia nuda]|uniref:Uncharacterized protein n=1 Tax=Collybia nuda TaxID=64659 RepID=A0A9P5Y619_9AGAR|nr:hypothetical protein BDZ94DRAFT_1309217 [Collybia nuda]
MHLTRPITPPFGSSPPSSPNPYLDSSPASSPGFDSLDTDLPDVPALRLSDPFAASMKATRRPPQYEKKRFMSQSTPPGRPAAKKPRHQYQQVREPDLKALCWPSPPGNECSRTIAPAKTPEEVEAIIWDEASTKVVDEGHGAVNLDNRNLTRIPESFISDLAHFYTPPESSELLNTNPNTRLEVAGRPLARASTAPTGAFEAGPRLFSRTRSAAAVSFGLPREELQLFLSSNRIMFLPHQLLDLKNLGVLSIRGNLISYIPPEIIGLVNLHTLNLANNKIRFLPAEMLQMSLTQLQVYPNPFIDPPRPSTPPTSGRRAFLRTPTVNQANHSFGERPVSGTTQMLPCVIPLVELSFRSLLSPWSTNSGETLLEKYYDLPLDECPADMSEPPTISRKRRFIYPIPSHLRTVLDLCAPYALYPDNDQSVDGDPSPLTGVGMCPSPHHRTYAGKQSVFIRHAEERFSWEQTIAGVRVGGAVPIQWRGCQWGCLDFLDKNHRTVAQAVHSPIVSTSRSSIDPRSTHAVDEEAVQLIQFNSISGGTSLDFDD